MCYFYKCTNVMNKTFKITDDICSMPHTDVKGFLDASIVLLFENYFHQKFHESQDGKLKSRRKTVQIHV